MGRKNDDRIRAGYEDSYDEEVEEQEAFINPAKIQYRIERV